MNKDFNIFYPSLPPQLEKNWHITDVLSHSGHSQVYIINYNDHSIETNNSQNKKVLKIINEELFNKNIYKKIQQINSPYIQKPIEVIKYKHNYYIIHNYQVNLTELICNNGIQISDILNIASDISCSLTLLHSYKIIHMDCTPSNIYINNDGSYCLGDFSSSLLFNNKKTSVTTTPGYTPPEITQGKAPNTLSDIYIFSCLLFTLCNNGYIPDFNNPDGNIKNNIPEKLYNTILKGCSVNPDERFSNFNEIKQALNSSELLDNIYNYNYNLYITDLQHPLYCLKTSLVSNQTYTIKQKNHKTYFRYIALVTVTCIIFIFSVFSYFTKNNVNQTVPASQDINNPNEIKEINEIDISRTGIYSLPNPHNTTFSCSKLTILYADVNNIDNLDNLIYYTSLEELYLADNPINNLSPLKTLRNLKILVLSYNDITDLSSVASLTSLNSLDLSGNQNLQNITTLCGLYNLKTLNLTNTNITKKEIGILNSSLPGCKIFY
ncbi:MAG: protein kinase [Lachnospiraceae bacterium]|nr:protein kinase [Lachnospiraceae bacterium]